MHWCTDFVEKKVSAQVVNALRISSCSFCTVECNQIFRDYMFEGIEIIKNTSRKTASACCCWPPLKIKPIICVWVCVSILNSVSAHFSLKDDADGQRATNRQTQRTTKNQFEICAYLWLLCTRFHDLVIIVGYQNDKSDLIKLMAIWLFIVFKLSVYCACGENTDGGKWTDNANFIQCEIIVRMAILCCKRWSRWSAHQWFFCVIEKKKRWSRSRQKLNKKKQRNASTRDIHE